MQQRCDRPTAFCQQRESASLTGAIVSSVLLITERSPSKGHCSVCVSSCNESPAMTLGLSVYFLHKYSGISWAVNLLSHQLPELSLLLQPGNAATRPAQSGSSWSVTIILCEEEVPLLCVQRERKAKSSSDGYGRESLNVLWSAAVKLFNPHLNSNSLLWKKLRGGFPAPCPTNYSLLWCAVNIDPSQRSSALP